MLPHSPDNRSLPRVTADQIQPIVGHYFNFWPNREDRRWFWLLWRCLESAGQTTYVTAEQETEIRGYVPCAALIYQEVGTSAGLHHTFHLTSEQCQSAWRDLGTEVDVIDRQLEVVWQAMISQLGSDEAWQELWLSVQLGSLGYAVSTKERHDRYQEAWKLLHSGDWNAEHSYRTYINGLDGLISLSNVYVPESLFRPQEGHDG